jgi:hypothetical protein
VGHGIAILGWRAVRNAGLKPRKKLKQNASAAETKMIVTAASCGQNHDTAMYYNAVPTIHFYQAMTHHSKDGRHPDEA